MSRRLMFGGIEAGGTKFVCMVGSGPDEVMAETRIATSTPDDTLAQVVEFFAPFRQAGKLSAIGIGSFGPCDLEPGSPKYGFITSTPKPGWQDTNIVGRLGSALSVSIAFDTDVNAAALGEHTWGATVGVDPSLYITIGTGIGGGMLIGGRPYHGLHHPEMGHIRIPHDFARDPFPGSCPFHEDCFEGLASGTAIKMRTGRRSDDLSDEDPIWPLEAQYIAAAIASLILVLSPRRIVLGGGIMKRAFLLELIRAGIMRSLAGYIAAQELASGIEQYLTSPRLGARAGVLGAIALARLIAPAAPV